VKIGECVAKIIGYNIAICIRAFIEMHNRLRALREGRGFETQKDFCYHAKKYGYSLSLRRYRDIERGAAVPTICEVRDICEAMKISADAWIFGAEGRIDIRGLSQERIEIVDELARMLFRLN
jgi:transcriptional regulator with XRE-family HTH domain